jgi:hypothetical protein
LRGVKQGGEIPRLAERRAFGYDGFDAAEAVRRICWRSLGRNGPSLGRPFF